MAIEKQFVPGDVEIVRFEIIPTVPGSAGKASYDIRSQAASIDIYESVTNPFLYAEIVMVDALDLLRTLPIIAEETVILEIKIPGTNASAEYKFRVKSVSNVTVNEQQTAKTYILTCVTEDYINSASTLVTDTYEQEIDQIIKSILTDKRYIGTQKNIITEPTKGVSKYLITRKQPFEAIDMLRRKAVAASNKTSSYCFFENKKGYYFTTLEKLFADNSKTVSDDRTFTFNTTVRQDLTLSHYRNIIGYEQTQSSDAIDKIQNGGFNNRVIAVDFATGTVTEINYTNDKDAELNKRTISGNQQQNTQTFRQKYGANISKLMLVPFNSFEDDNELPEKISIMHAYTMKLAQNISRINIWGDCDITCGDVIYCNLPSGSREFNSGNDNLQDKLSRGKFLISKIKHNIQFGPRPAYTQAMEIINGSMFESVGG